MNVRNYPVPRPVLAAANRASVGDALCDSAIRAARSGRVRGFHLPVLASGSWRAGADWAGSVLEREVAARGRRAEALLASIGYDPDGDYLYHGVLDSSYPDHELIVSVARSQGDGTALEKWDGLDWGTAEVSPDGLEFVLLDQEVLVDVLDAIDTGSAGVMLRPFNPKAWTRDAAVLDYPVLAAATPRHTGVMVALPIDPVIARRLAVPGGETPSDLHVTLAYLGDSTEEAIDYQAVQRATARWVRRIGDVLTGEISGPGKFTAGEKPVSVALVDIPDLPSARELLVRLLAAEGVQAKQDHGYTPHITLAYDDLDLKVPNFPLVFGAARVHYADDIQEYPFGEAVVAAGGAGPDIFYAIVDEFDTNAVLDLVKVLPGPVAYRRSGGKWVKDQNLLMRLMGVDPPPVVEVSPEQTEDVLAQVDAYDKANPEPVTAAVAWDEKKFKRGTGGKFATKPKQKTTIVPGKGPKRPTSEAKPTPPGRRVAPTVRDPGRAMRSSYRGVTPDEVRKAPWKLLEGGTKGSAIDHLGISKDWWDQQPDGFREWLNGFLKEKQTEAEAERKDGKTKESDDGKNEKGERKGEAGDGKRDVAKGDQRSAAQIAAQKKAAASGGKKSGAKNLAAYMDEVPAKYRKSMREFIHLAAKNAAAVDSGEGSGRGGSRSGSSRGGDGSGGELGEQYSSDSIPRSPSADRIKQLDKADRDFDLSFAKEGLGESRRREIFDRQLTGLADRLLKSGASAQAIGRLMRQKVMEEKRRREQFERKRRMQAEQEQVRRMAARNRETDLQDREGVTAAGKPATTRMPGDLQEYWVAGEGAAKIRWGTGGDFDRCRRSLSKYLRPDQISGACANLHRLATGSWPGKNRKH